ncbi:hypothetical protein PgNI_10428 [Pyricularia grisea]|uniref:Uncharacterized protein n=1 Tax=Pyricularia grisea TaxID=148305 RepID=A0A6P8AYA9_PYRGI|nr:hypothetical protein PgNI_10428 [Pyricularia grisea]TLD07266.1 hypothetical protein PgNI_10428 [Pyricularia grisea]
MVPQTRRWKREQDALALLGDGQTDKRKSSAKFGSGRACISRLFCVLGCRPRKWKEAISCLGLRNEK